MRAMRLLSTIAILSGMLSAATADDYIEIGNNVSYTVQTANIPFNGNRGYGWSQTIYPQSEIGGSCMITGLSFNLNNTPANFIASGQRIYLAETSRDSFADSAYEDPVASGYELVFEGDINWNGSGWFTIEFDTPYMYEDSGNLLLHFEHRDGVDYRSGYPNFRCRQQASAAKYKNQSGSFPTSNGFRSDWQPMVRLHWSSQGPWQAADVQPADAARAVLNDATPTLSWSNRNEVSYNAVYFSLDQNEVLAKSESARVLYDGSSVYSSYTHSEPLAPGTTYYWNVEQFFPTHSYSGDPLSFTTEPLAQSSYPWSEGFENAGDIPDYWSEQQTSGAANWSFQSGGIDGSPASAAAGEFNAVFGGSGDGSRTLLVAPVLDLSGAVNPVLSFRSAQPGVDGVCDSLRIYYRNTADGEWLPLQGGEFSSPSSQWRRSVVGLYSTSATCYIAFEGQDNGGQGVCLDDVRVMDSHASLRLEVFDSQGDPLHAAPFQIFLQPGDEEAFDSGETESDGSAIVMGLDPGEVSYRIDEAFHGPARGSVDVLSGSVVTQRVDLAASAHFGGVVRENGGGNERIEGVIVNLYTPDTEPELVASDSTDAFGQYRFTRVDPGDYEIVAIHPAYETTREQVELSTSDSHDLLLNPLPGNFFDVYVQVNCVLSGWPITGTDVTLTVTESTGLKIYEQTGITDDDGNLTFRGVPAGTAVFACNQPGPYRQPWWENYTSEPEVIVNSKMANIRLEPMKSATSVTIEFNATDHWGKPIDPTPFIQHFWIEAQGWDSETGRALYPARTALSDENGQVEFEELPTLPTRITVRRPGFANSSLMLIPDHLAMFPGAITMNRPAITPGTDLDLVVEQNLLSQMDISQSAMASVKVEGLPGGNSEGYSEHYRYALEESTQLPLPIDSDHGQMSVWGQASYSLSPGEEGYVMVHDDLDGFYVRLDFDPLVLPLVEGESNQHAISADFKPGTLEGCLFAADEMTEDGQPIYQPVANKDVRFVLHEDARPFYQAGHETHTVTTDADGRYRVQLPPGIYGIEIPGMPGYWGAKVETTTVVGWSGPMGSWPYASRDWSSDAGSSGAYEQRGFSLSSGHHSIMNLYVNLQRYAIYTLVTEDSPLRSRLLYRGPNGDPTAWRSVFDLLESETTLSLGAAGEAAIHPYSDDLRAIWTDLDGGTFTIDGSDHAYLGSTSTVSHTTFNWGNYPGDPPATEPPYGEELDETPLPMFLYRTDDYEMEPNNELGSLPLVTVTYATGDELNPIASTQKYPSFVEFKDLPGKVYNTGRENDLARIKRYFVEYSVDGSSNVYAVPGGGPYAVNTITQAPTPMPTASYTLDVRAVPLDNPSEEVEDFPFVLQGVKHTAPKTFSGLTSSVPVGFDYDAPSAWQPDVIRYRVDSESSPTRVQATLFCRPRVRVQGVVRNSSGNRPVNDALIEVMRADGVGTHTPKGSSSSGQFYVGYANSRAAHLVNISAPGYLPYRERFVLDDYIVGEDTFFDADIGTIELEPIAVNVGMDSWNRQGTVLHGVQAAGSAEESESSEALQLTVAANASVPLQSYTVTGYDLPDGTPGAPSSHQWNDSIAELRVIDARYRDSNGELQAYSPATADVYYPGSSTSLPPASDPEKIRDWMNDSHAIMKLDFGEASSAVSATGTVSVAALRPGLQNPYLAVRTRGGAYALTPVSTPSITSLALPRWLAFAADAMANAAAAQASYNDLKETYASNVPDGKLSALPSLSGGISENDGYLRYDYELGVAWEEGSTAPDEGGLSIGPGLLGLNFEAGAAIGFDGQNQSLTLDVGGSVGKEEIDLEDYAPGFVKDLGIEGEISQASGKASTRRSTALVGDRWDERELATSVGASVDLTLRYNLEGITGTIPYVGPMLVLADKTGTLQLFGRLDMGARLQNLSTWRTVEPNRSQEIGQPEANPSDSAPINSRSDDLALTPNRHCLGGQENNSGVYSNQFDLGLHFGAGFEGSGLGEHLNVFAGIEITGNEDDLVAGQPSLIITPNTYGDWPPIKRVQGDVNAFLRATLDAYVTEIEKDWTINLARINYEYTTESSLSMADVVVNVVERPTDSTVFTGVRPAVVRNLPKGSSFALHDGMLAFGFYDEPSQRTDLKISLADGNGYAEPVTVAEDVEGLGRIRLTAIGPADYLLLWEERPGLEISPAAYSEIHSALYTGGTWQPPQRAVSLYSYLCDMELFASTRTNSLVYVQSPDYYDRTQTAVRAVNYDSTTDAWSKPVTVQPLAENRDTALACAGYTSVEPGRLLSIAGSSGVASMYWDGSHSSVPGGTESVQIETADSRRTVLSAQGTNETLWASTLTETGELLLHRYTIDPARDPLNPDYDWNGRAADVMWPAVAALGSEPAAVNDLANGCLPEADQLLTAWSVLGNLRGQWFDTGTQSNGAACIIAGSFGGAYDDIQVTARSNTLARVAAIYTAPDVRELRVFDIEAEAVQNSEDADGDGIPDRLEQALVDADSNDAIIDIRDVHATDDFDGDGFDNATEWAHGTRADLVASRPSLGVEIDAAVLLAREDGLLPGSFLVKRPDSDPATDLLTVFYSVSGTATEGADYQPIPRSIVIAAGDSSAAIDILPLADENVEGKETVIVTLLPHEDYVLGVDAQAVVNILDASHDDWRGGYFSPEELTDPEIGADDADPDGDGIPNRLEFALGTDPRTANPSELEMIIDGDDLLLGYRYDPRVEDALITIQQNTNLLDSTWSPSGGMLLYREALPDQREEVFYHLLPEAVRGFYRLRID